MKTTDVMPALFVGHGSPMNAVEKNRWQEGFRRLSGLFDRPRAILSISAHWYTGATLVTSSPRPGTIHDFYGFPEELYRISYPAEGDPELAARVASITKTGRLDSEWGLDHGTWAVLMHAYPEADIPVVQLSVDGNKPAAAHFALGEKLRELRGDGVLVFGSGNIVHNLPYVFSRYFAGDLATPGWAERFDEKTAASLVGGDSGTLINALDTADGRDAHPTPDHYLPLLYVAGAALAGGEVEFPIEGFDMGSLSMRAVLIR